MSLPAGSYQPAVIEYLDAGNEVGKMRFYGAPLTAANIVAKTADWGGLVAAADGLALGNRIRDQYADDSHYVVSQPTNGAARETKLLIQYRDSVTGEKMTTTLPTLDPTIPQYVINANARDVVIMTAPSAIVNFKTAFEGFAVNPRTGNSVVIYGLKVVGRNT